MRLGSKWQTPSVEQLFFPRKMEHRRFEGYAKLIKHLTVWSETDYGPLENWCIEAVSRDAVLPPSEIRSTMDDEATLEDENIIQDNSSSEPDSTSAQSTGTDESDGYIDSWDEWSHAGQWPDSLRPKSVTLCCFSRDKFYDVDSLPFPLHKDLAGLTLIGGSLGPEFLHSVSVSFLYALKSPGALWKLTRH